MAYLRAANWNSWIASNWESLVAGEKIGVPAWLAPLAQAGFKRQEYALPTGQVADWTLSLTDRSRIHMHVFSDGRRIVHRDQHDPDQGLGDMLAHLLFETPIGPLALVASVVVAASRAK